MKVAFLGAGAWGFCLAEHLAKKGVSVVCWVRKRDFAERFNQTKTHPKLLQKSDWRTISFTSSLKEALSGSDFIVEAVTSSGFREVMNKLKRYRKAKTPLIIASKGIEHDTGYTLPEVAVDVLGSKSREMIALLSGPGYASEIICGLPASVVVSAYDEDLAYSVGDLFTTRSLRIFVERDIKGVAVGGALKNIIAIACGLCHGINLGVSCLAAVMTRGLHEIRTLGVAMGCKEETFYGLSGMGDLFLTCSSKMSRNFRFGEMLAHGVSSQDILVEMGQAVEGFYSCHSALQLGERYGISLPIASTVDRIIKGELHPQEVFSHLMQGALERRDP